VLMSRVQGAPNNEDPAAGRNIAVQGEQRGCKAPFDITFLFPHTHDAARPLPPSSALEGGHTVSHRAYCIHMSVWQDPVRMGEAPRGREGGRVFCVGFSFSLVMLLLLSSKAADMQERIGMR
jgi:hypothetical protein